MADLPKRRWLRFSLRAMLLAFTVFAVWFGLHFQAARKQRSAVDVIERSGGWARYDYQFPSGEYEGGDDNAQSSVPSWLLNALGRDVFHDVVQVGFSANPVGFGGPAATTVPLHVLAGLPDLRALLLSDCDVSESDMPYLETVARLEVLWMFEVNGVGDSGIAHLQSLDRLRFLVVSKSELTNAALRSLGNMPALRQLYLRSDHFTDSGLKHLLPLTEVEELALCGSHEGQNQISNAGIMLLTPLSRLTLLDLLRTQVTAEGATAFERQLPNCKVAH